METKLIVSCTRAVVITAMFCVMSVAQTQVSITTQHNDVGRTGQNTGEQSLTTSSVVDTKFGLICKITLSSVPTFPAAYSYQVYAQPLVVANGDGSQTIYVVTHGDYVYSITIPANFLNNCSSLTYSYKSLIDENADAPAYPVDCCHFGGGGCKTIAPTVGALGTPVIDPVTKTLYVVSQHQVGPFGTYTPGQNCTSTSAPSSWVHLLHALDLSSSNFLQEKYNGPATIQGSAPVTSKLFSSEVQIQRPGLLLLPGSPNNTVYAGFSMMDGAHPPFPPGGGFLPTMPRTSPMRIIRRLTQQLQARHQV
jgi:hypothetical protein